ncbi:MAG: hypothetical protein WDZ88_01430 [Candidatus Paceibacterota bacterium]
MHISKEAVQAILGIENKVKVSLEDMADNLNITFFPHKEKSSPEIDSFVDDLKKVFDDLKVNIVPYEQSLEKIKLRKRIARFFKIIANNLLFLIGKSNIYIPIKDILPMLKAWKLKPGISIIVSGEQKIGRLPMEHISNFKDNSVITVLPFPEHITSNSTFSDHFDTAMNFFAYHMTNIVIGVDKEKWMLYNFNASHPVFSREGDMRNNVLKALVPKIVAPIRPYKYSEFIVKNNSTDLNSPKYLSIIEDLMLGAKIFSDTNLYPKGKKITDLPFRTSFHKWIGQLHLDGRSGMSFGFIAKQLPAKLSKLISEKDFANKIISGNIPDSDYFFVGKKIYLKIVIDNENFWLQVPDVCVLSLRSGSNKTNPDPKKDFILLGLEGGSMTLEAPKGIELNKDYKPSFDTQVILAHAVGNAIIASILNHLDTKNNFSKQISNYGISISHWHGYFNKKYIPDNMMVYGEANPHVSCSSPQSAIFALKGKIEEFFSQNRSYESYIGDIHIEPHHGTNICYPLLKDLGEYIKSNPESTELGNRYL